MLWVGWFGFNAGSALAANGDAGMAMLVTHIGAAGGSLAWMVMEWFRFGKPSVLGIVTGMVAGLGTITPASGFVGPAGALIIGFAAGFVCFWATQIVKRTFEIDDSLDVFPVHGVGGFLGLFLTAFLANRLGGQGFLNENILTTAVIAVITIIGLTRGLSFLETLEAWSLVAILIIVLALMAGFAWYDFGRHSPAEWQMPVAPGRSAWEVATIVGGTLIVVQGFETTRYLGAQYSPETRVSASRWSQIIATAVYLCFVALAVPLLFTLDGQYNDHSLIQLTAAAAAILVTPLIIAAALSQFSAAVADTLAAAGNLDELTHGHLNSRWAYLIVGIVAIALTWTAHSYEIMSRASRAFALYYMLQCFVAISVSTSTLKRICFAMLSVVLGFITIFAVPAG